MVPVFVSNGVPAAGIKTLDTKASKMEYASRSITTSPYLKPDTLLTAVRAQLFAQWMGQTEPAAELKPSPAHN